MPAERFHYFRAHQHPLGWGVNDSKTGCVVAFGDKGICATVADLLNGKSDPGLLTKWAEFYDSYTASGGLQFEYNHDTGETNAR